MNTAYSRFQSWAEDLGCEVTVTQPDDGSGYVVCKLQLPDGSDPISITVMETDPTDAEDPGYGGDGTFADNH